MIDKVSNNLNDSWGVIDVVVWTVKPVDSIGTNGMAVDSIGWSFVDSNCSVWSLANEEEDSAKFGVNSLRF